MTNTLKPESTEPDSFSGPDDEAEENTDTNETAENLRSPEFIGICREAFSSVLESERDTFERFVEPYEDEQAEEYARTEFSATFSTLDAAQQGIILDQVRKYALDMRSMLDASERFLRASGEGEVAEKADVNAAREFTWQSLLEARKWFEEAPGIGSDIAVRNLENAVEERRNAYLYTILLSE
ncbi:hypothetical protein JXA34_04135 [Patescibacteria group bacterium]|nr:hypothetical protein [Patescibacteria group bacterium]